MYLVRVVFNQWGQWSKPYSYICPRECGEHVIVPAGAYMSVGRVVSCEPISEISENLKPVYGPVNYDYLGA